MTEKKSGACGCGCLPASSIETQKPRDKEPDKTRK